MTKTHHHTENSSSASSAVEGAVDALRTASQHIVDGTVQGYQAVSDKTRDMVKQTDRYVRHNPWMAVGAGVGVGFLLGLYLRRGRN